MGIWMVTHKAVLLGQQIRNVYYYETEEGDPSTSEWQDIVDEIRADYVAELVAFLAEQYVFAGINYRKVDVAGLLAFSAVPTAGTWAGEAVGDPVATQVAALVSVKGVTTKPNRARTYFAGLVEGVVDLSLIVAAAREALETFVDMQSVLNAGGTNPLQRVSAQWNTSHTMVTVTNNIAGSAAVCSIVPATQRRRRIGQGI